MTVESSMSEDAKNGLMAWIKTKQFKPGDTPGRKIAIFSPPGYGKTVLAVRLGKRNLIITDEDGFTSLTNHPELNGTWTGLPFTSWSIVRKILELVESGDYAFDDGEPFDNVIFDTVTGMISLEIQKIVKDGITTEKGKVSAEVAGRPDYLVSEQRLIPLMSQIAHMQRCSVTMLFHTRIGDKLTIGDNTRLDTHAAAFKVINKYLSVIAYLNIVDGKRMLKVMPTGDGVSVKTRHHFPSETVTDDVFVAEIQKWKETK